MLLGFAMAAIDRISPSSRTAKILGVAFCVSSLAAPFAVVGTYRSVDWQRNAYATARDNWLRDCTHMGPRIDQCTKAWSDDPTLREIYIERIEK